MIETIEIIGGSTIMKIMPWRSANLKVQLSCCCANWTWSIPSCCCQRSTNRGCCCCATGSSRWTSRDHDLSQQHRTPPGSKICFTNLLNARRLAQQKQQMRRALIHNRISTKALVQETKFGGSSPTAQGGHNKRNDSSPQDAVRYIVLSLYI